jgi:rRNA-processing protein FCF1
MAGMRTCSNCGKTFKPKTILAIKLGTKRLERCPHCRKWVDVYAPPVVKEQRERHEMVMSDDDMLRRRIEESKEERT